MIAAIVFGLFVLGIIAWIWFENTAYRRDLDRMKDEAERKSKEQWP